MSWTAKYPGRCAVCRRRIEAGQHEVEWHADSIHLRHVGCVETPAPDLCPRCFQIPTPTGVCGCD